jgi:dephospho-CoA kinase
MKKNILGVIGKPGAGKDTFCDFLEERDNSVEVLKFSDPLSEVLRIFFEEVKREDQQWLVNQLRDNFGEDILAKAIKKKIKELKTDYVLLNGIRVWDDYDMLKEVEGSLVFIKTDSKLRWERTKKRGEKKDDDVSYEKVLELDQGRSERQIEKIGAKADFVIDNNGTKKELEEQVFNLIKKLNGK